jgi:hypothetical protein
MSCGISRGRSDTVTLHGVGVRLFGLQRAVKNAEGFTVFVQAAADLDHTRFSEFSEATGVSSVVHVCTDEMRQKE